MKTLRLLRHTGLFAMTVAVAAFLPALADGPAGSHDSHHPAGDAAAAAPPAPAAAAQADASSPMMLHMKQMQEQMAKIRAAKDPKERAALLDEHLKSMQDTMKLMMDSDGGCPMMGKGAAGMMGHGNMMQMMMDQMMQHQHMMQGPGK